MAQDPKIAASLNITALSLKGDSVASQFNNVLELNLDFFFGKLKGRDAVLGPFSFNLNEIDTVTYTISGTSTTIVMS